MMKTLKLKMRPKRQSKPKPEEIKTVTGKSKQYDHASWKQSFNGLLPVVNLKLASFVGSVSSSSSTSSKDSVSLASSFSSGLSFVGAGVDVGVKIKDNVKSGGLSCAGPVSAKPPTRLPKLARFTTPSKVKAKAKAKSPVPTPTPSRIPQPRTKGWTETDLVCLRQTVDASARMAQGVHPRFEGAVVSRYGGEGMTVLDFREFGRGGAVVIGEDTVQGVKEMDERGEEKKDEKEDLAVGDVSVLSEHSESDVSRYSDDEDDHLESQSNRSSIIICEGVSFEMIDVASLKSVGNASFSDSSILTQASTGTGEGSSVETRVEQDVKMYNGDDDSSFDRQEDYSIATEANSSMSHCEWREEDLSMDRDPIAALIEQLFAPPTPRAVKVKDVEDFVDEGNSLDDDWDEDDWSIIANASTSYIVEDGDEGEGEDEDERVDMDEPFFAFQDGLETVQGSGESFSRKEEHGEVNETKEEEVDVESAGEEDATTTSPTEKEEEVIEISTAVISQEAEFQEEIREEQAEFSSMLEELTELSTYWRRSLELDGIDVSDIYKATPPIIETPAPAPLVESSALVMHSPQIEAVTLHPASMRVLTKTIISSSKLSSPSIHIPKIDISIQAMAAFGFFGFFKRVSDGSIRVKVFGPERPRLMEVKTIECAVEEASIVEVQSEDDNALQVVLASEVPRPIPVEVVLPVNPIEELLPAAVQVQAAVAPVTSSLDMFGPPLVVHLPRLPAKAKTQASDTSFFKAASIPIISGLKSMIPSTAKVEPEVEGTPKTNTNGDDEVEKKAAVVRELQRKAPAHVQVIAAQDVGEFFKDVPAKAKLVVDARVDSSSQIVETVAKEVKVAKYDELIGALLDPSSISGDGPKHEHYFKLFADFLNHDKSRAPVSQESENVQVESATLRSYQEVFADLLELQKLLTLQRSVVLSTPPASPILANAESSEVNGISSPFEVTHTGYDELLEGLLKQVAMSYTKEQLARDGVVPTVKEPKPEKNIPLVTSSRGNVPGRTSVFASVKKSLSAKTLGGTSKRSAAAAPAVKEKKVSAKVPALKHSVATDGPSTTSSPIRSVTSSSTRVSTLPVRPKAIIPVNATPVRWTPSASRRDVARSPQAAVAVPRTVPRSTINAQRLHGSNQSLNTGSVSTPGGPAPFLKAASTVKSPAGISSAKTSSASTPKRPPTAAPHILDTRTEAVQHLEAARHALRALKTSNQGRSNVRVGEMGLCRIEQKAVTRVRYE